MSAIRHSSIDKSRQHGSAMVELAIVAPVLVFLMMAIAEFGHVFYQYDIIIKAVRNGAAHVAQEASTSSGSIELSQPNLISNTKNLVVYGTPTSSGSPLLPNWNTDAVTVSQVDPLHVEVRATYQYSPLWGVDTLPFTDIPVNFTFKAGVVMRAL